ncbi:capsule biosynthesis GfcC family protein [uncultured Photobacterium sp.]|uniref:capsule biosynthesis GfcC family protein n=1 Tax=uncultured Photobacterium sp. TaxID=173973 RepID=UPI00261DBC2C|nr:capsule biosynthesis GfcC family protein [uncultured Photobacterium sp.]
MTKPTSLLTRSKSVALLALALSGLFGASPLMAESVDVQLTTAVNNTQHLKLSYPSPVRLQQVLADGIANLNQLPLSQELAQKAGYDAQVYWPGAALLVASGNPEKKRILGKLSVLSNIWQDEERQAVINFQALLQNEKIGQRIFNSLDYDQVRIDLTQNPLISKGITVILPPRPNSIWVMGAVSKPTEVKWHERLDAQHYLTQAVPISSSDNSYAWVIQPDGSVEKHPIAYWNKKHMDIAPGAVIYLGFTSLPNDLDTLNEELINLLRNRTL